MEPMEQPEMQAPAEEQGAGGYAIEIVVAADGTITVDVEPGAAEAAEGEPSTGKQVAGIKEAIQVVMDIYKNSGQMLDGTEGDVDFSAGFGAGGPSNGGALPSNPAKRFG